MDPTAFDTLARAFSTGGSRRLLVRLVAALPLAGVLVAEKEAPVADAAHPVERIQKRRDRHRQRKRRRQDHQHELQTRDNGSGGTPGGGLGSGPGCGGCPAGASCCDNECCPAPCCGGECCPPPRYSCCGTGVDATCCPTTGYACCAAGIFGTCFATGGSLVCCGPGSLGEVCDYSKGDCCLGPNELCCHPADQACLKYSHCVPAP